MWLDVYQEVCFVSYSRLMFRIANILPLRRALSRTLRDSLDLYHMVISDISVRVVKLADLGLDLWVTALSLLMVVMGFIVYYLVPLAFLLRNFSLFLAILNGILMAMLVGLCMLAMVIQPYLERAVLWALLWGRQRRLHGLIRKNLAGHRSRNAKTAQMFTLSIAFIVFAGTMFALQSLSLEDNIRVFAGSDIIILGPDQENSLRVPEMSTYLDDQIQRRKNGDPTAVVTAYSFVTFEFGLFDTIDNAFLSNLPRNPSDQNSVFGVQANYLESVYAEYLDVYQKNEQASYRRVGGKSDVFWAMFADGGNARLPEEQGGIRVPAPISSGSRLQFAANGSYSESNATRNIFDVSASASALNQSYTGYVEVLATAALRNIFRYFHRSCSIALTVAYGLPSASMCRVRWTSASV